MGFWKTGREHKTEGKQRSVLGRTHTDTHHTNKADKRDQPHHKDLKVSGPKHSPSMKDIHHPSGKK